MSRNTVRMLTGAAVVVALAWGTGPAPRAADRTAGGAAIEKAAAIITVAAAPAAAPAAPQPQAKAKSTARQQRTVTDATGRKHVIMKRITQAERQAAAARLQAKTARSAKTTPGRSAMGARTLGTAATTQGLTAGVTAQALSTGVTSMPGAIPSSQLLIGANGQLVPDYSGLTPNYANSPMPTVIPATTISVGNDLIARATPSDLAANVFVMLPQAVTAQGTLESFQSYNEPGAAGLQFHAYVLRPTGNPDEYSVVFDSGALTVPALPVASPGQVETYPMPSAFAVNVGDRIAWYGQGIPIDIGSGTDVLCYPAGAGPLAGATITLGAGDFPYFPQARTYSFAAMIATTATTTGGIRKFVDGLPGLTAAGANNLNQYIPVAVPEEWCSRPEAPTTGCVSADYYEIELGQFTEKLHSDLPPTTLRGYKQTNTTNPTVSQFHYLGPFIVAQKGRPVRVKFTNRLPTGATGNLFIPVDPTVMGAGPGPNVSDATRTATTADVLCQADANGAIPGNCYTQNRATIHLHGGVTPWISDGTTHQWITPAGEATSYPEGVSVYNVPDMPNPGKPGTATHPAGTGVQTFYYTNNQTARLMFYHDHAHGITRLNVYVGEASGYLVRDQVEASLIANGYIPADEIPLVIQDKTFVDASTIDIQDPTWNWGTGATFTTYTDPNGKTMQKRAANTGDLWWPHVYMPAQNPYDVSGLNAMGRWHYGPWFWPPAPVTYGPVPNPYYQPICAVNENDPACTMPWQPQEIPGTPQPSVGAEAFLDTPVINGTAYPTLKVDPKAYRLRVLNAAHDRFWNLQLYVAADKNTPTTEGAVGTRLCDGSAVIPATDCTEVKMVPAATNVGLPANWPVDGREGGLPDPATKGPDFVQIGTEGGFLPKPVVVPTQPIAWNMDPTTFNFGNVSDHALLLGPAERADVIVDFSAYAGKTLILYNDAPAAFPALDARNDYYTGAPDRTDTGGVAGTLPGYGPNIRTIMQIQVAAATGVPTPFNVDALMTAWAPDPANAKPGVFEQSQDKIIVGQAAYTGVYTDHTTTPASLRTFPSTYPYWGLARIQDTSMAVQTVDGPRVTLNFEHKAIHDEMGASYDDFGRMSTALGIEIPQTNAQNQNFVLQGYSDPPTELVKLSKIADLIGYQPDGTQIWKITHNGVDTHPVHFHLFHVQLINRVGWDGAIRLPDETELGWKDTVRISPLEDTIVALRPIAPDTPALPFKVPNSIRPLEPALPIGSTLAFRNVDPLGNPITPGITNQLTNFGWEYIWHCHILSHEENDMMRAVGFAVPPEDPSNLAAVAQGTGVARVTWVDNSLVASGFVLERAPDPGFAAGVVSIPLGQVTAYTDNVGTGGTYYYRVKALNTIGSSVPGYPTITAESGYSGAGNVTLVGGPSAPTGLTATATGPTAVSLTWSYTQGATAATSFLVQRATGSGAFATIATRAAANGTNTYTNSGLTPGVTYRYQVVATSASGNSLPSNIATVQTPLVTPTNLRVTTNLRNAGVGRIIIAWSDPNTVNTTNFQVYRSTNGGANWTLAATTAVTTLTYQTLNTVRGTTYSYRVQAVQITNGTVTASSAFTPTVSVVAK